MVARSQILVLVAATALGLASVSSAASALPSDDESFSIEDVQTTTVETATAARIVETSTTAFSSDAPTDGDYHIGDVTDGRPLRWSSSSEADGRTKVFLVPIARDARIIGFVRSDEFFAEQDPPNLSQPEYLPSFTIVDEAGVPIGRFVDGRPRLQSDG